MNANPVNVAKKFAFGIGTARIVAKDILACEPGLAHDDGKIRVSCYW